MISKISSKLLLPSFTFIYHLQIQSFFTYLHLRNFQISELMFTARI